MAINQAGVGTGAGMHIDVVLTTEDENGKVEHHNVSIDLDVEQQRQIIERETGEKCFRMWLSDDERKQISFALNDAACYRLKDGRWAYWRKESDLEALKTHGEMTVLENINKRRLPDEVI